MKIEINRDNTYTKQNKLICDNICLEAEAGELDLLTDVIKTIPQECGIIISIHGYSEEYILEYGFNFDKAFNKMHFLRMSRVDRECRHLLWLKDNFTEYQLNNFKELIKVINSRRGGYGA